MRIVLPTHHIMSTSSNIRGDPKKIEKSASQGSTTGSVSSAAKERNKGKEGKERKGDRSVHSSNSNVGTIRTSTAGKNTAEGGPSRRTSAAPGTPAEKDKEGKTEKGILKNKKSRARSMESKKSTIKAKGKVKPPKKTFMEKMAHSFGFHVGEVVLRDPWAVEAAQALDLQQWHLRRLKVRFDKIDLDGSGNIDYDEFFESIGEVRSPFTDKLFALIGTVTIPFAYLYVLCSHFVSANIFQIWMGPGRLNSMNTCASWPPTACSPRTKYCASVSSASMWTSLAPLMKKSLLNSASEILTVFSRVLSIYFILIRIYTFHSRCLQMHQQCFSVVSEQL